MALPKDARFGYSGVVTLLFSKVTAVCESSLPWTDAPVFRAIRVLDKTIPSKCEVVPRVTRPATCQNTFLACAPPIRFNATPSLTTRLPAIWKIHTSFALPESVTFLGNATLELHL